jgi:hypothetical protein
MRRPTPGSPGRIRRLGTFFQVLPLTARCGVAISRSVVAPCGTLISPMCFTRLDAGGPWRHLNTAAHVAAEDPALGAALLTSTLLGLGVAGFAHETPFHQLLQSHNFYWGTTELWGIFSDGPTKRRGNEGEWRGARTSNLGLGPRQNRQGTVHVQRRVSSGDAHARRCSRPFWVRAG